jgi:hypothetical protein
MYVQRNTRALSREHLCHGKAIIITYFECVYVCVCVCVCVALIMHHAKLMRRYVLSSVACLALPYSSTLSHKRYGFRKSL